MILFLGDGKDTREGGGEEGVVILLVVWKEAIVPHRLRKRALVISAHFLGSFLRSPYL
jgi:hypothetical protein